jgi:hypothetical protein
MTVVINRLTLLKKSRILCGHFILCKECRSALWKKAKAPEDSDAQAQEEAQKEQTQEKINLCYAAVTSHSVAGRA